MKNLFGLGIVLAMILGIALSFIPQQAKANLVDGSVPCYSASYEALKCDYTKCIGCCTVDGRHWDGTAGTCTPTPK